MGSHPQWNDLLAVVEFIGGISTVAIQFWNHAILFVNGQIAMDPRCCCGTSVCYRVTGNSVYGENCCADGGCCNYGDGPIDEVLPGGPPTWAAYGRGPVGTSDWTLVRAGAGPIYTWTLTNNCQSGCHPGAYTGTAQWDGEGSKVFQMGNYPALTVTKVPCP